MTDIFAKEYCRHGDDARPTLRGGKGLVCELCGGKIPEKKGDEARESCSTMTPEQVAAARAMIGQQQQIILKQRQFKAKADEAILTSQRIINDLKNQFGLKE